MQLSSPWRGRLRHMKNDFEQLSYDINLNYDHKHEVLVTELQPVVQSALPHIQLLLCQPLLQQSPS